MKNNDGVSREQLYEMPFGEFLKWCRENKLADLADRLEEETKRRIRAKIVTRIAGRPLEEVLQQAASEGLSIEEWMAKNGVGVEYTPMEQATLNPPKMPRSPDPFNGGETADAPNNPFTHFFLGAVADGGPLARFKPGGWHENQYDGQPQYIKLNVGCKGATWRTGIDAQSRNAAELWKIVERLNTLHMHAAMYFLAKMGDPRNGVSYPLMEAVTVSSDEMLKVKGIQNRGHSRQILQRDLSQCVKDLADLTTDVRDIQLDGKRVHIPNCKLFHIAEVYEEQLDLLGPPERIHVGWSVQAGQWATYWFKDGGRYWVSALARALLELDHRNDRRAHILAFRIGAMLLTIAGGTDFRNRTLTLTIERLLSSIGELPDAAHRGKDWARRMDEALQKALDTLQAQGVLATYGFGPTYPDPGDRGRGWSERWLAAEITLTTVEAAAMEQAALAGTAKLPPQLEKKRRNRGTGKTRRPHEEVQKLDTDTTAAIYAKYKGLNWTQETLAKHLGCKRPTLSNILTRREGPGIELATRIRAFLDTPNDE